MLLVPPVDGRSSSELELSSSSSAAPLFLIGFPCVNLSSRWFLKNNLLGPTCKVLHTGEKQSFLEDWEPLHWRPLDTVGEDDCSELSSEELDILAFLFLLSFLLLTGGIFEENFEISDSGVSGTLAGEWSLFGVLLLLMLPEPDSQSFLNSLSCTPLIPLMVSTFFLLLYANCSKRDFLFEVAAMATL